jgi:hypothetical protein
MQRILALDEPQNMPAEPSAPKAGSGYGFKDDFELVVGRRQVAAFAFLALVLVVVCSGAAYLAGKAISAHEGSQLGIKVEPSPALPPTPILEATVVGKPAASAPKSDAEAPLFASSVPQGTYIQVGVVEKGVATVIAEGLRRHALGSFVAPGPNDKVFRVLIGPLPDLKAYEKARNIVAEIGLTNFSRRYQPQ